jgi:N-acyl-D-amino-acid deacylase
MQKPCWWLACLVAGCLASKGTAADYDLVIRHGTIYDGSGRPPILGDLAVKGDAIVAVGIVEGRGKKEVDAQNLAVAPGFINVLSWATESLAQDGRSQSDIRQGVTLEVFGEGESFGPLNETMKKDKREQQGDLKYPVEWTTLGEYLDFLAERGVSCNVASFVGATTVRVHELGYADRAPTPAELERMKALVRQAMEEGALGVGSALIYAPAFYAKTDELVELCKVAAQYHGLYISHIRSEGTRLLEAADELLHIAREAQISAEFYHLKAAGQANWGKLEALLEKIEQARAGGMHVTANMYTYTAASTGLDAAMPPWVQEGGFKEWSRRLQDPAIRARVKSEMATPTDQWENFFVAVGSPENILLVGFKNPKLKALTGKSLAEVAKQRGQSPQETAMDLVIEDHSRVEAIYFLMSEDNVRKELALPWVSFGSDEASLAPEGAFLRANPHPRAYGNFARVLGKYVRDEKIVSLAEAIRRLSRLPAENLKLERRGALQPGYYADIVIFDPDKIQDHASFAQPHQYATGVRDVWVNGVPVLAQGNHTDARPGRVVRGPGWKGPRPLVQVHAHNDYEHPRPLFDALAHGFCSVEADVHLVDGQLLVAHDRGQVKPERTLQALYLDPLRERVKKNGGRVYPGGPECTLLIDIKGHWQTTYPVLRKILENYSDILTTFRSGTRDTKAVVVVATGDRSKEMFTGETVRYAAYDGDLPDLDSQEPADLIPWISSNWANTFKWRGRDTLPEAERRKLTDMVAKAHQYGRRLRFWGAPDQAGFWREMLANGVDLINTDDLEGAQKFLRNPTR